MIYCKNGNNFYFKGSWTKRTSNFLQNSVPFFISARLISVSVGMSEPEILTRKRSQLITTNHILKMNDFVIVKNAWKCGCSFKYLKVTTYYIHFISTYTTEHTAFWLDPLLTASNDIERNIVIGSQFKRFRTQCLRYPKVTLFEGKCQTGMDLTFRANPSCTLGFIWTKTHEIEGPSSYVSTRTLHTVVVVVSTWRT